VLSLVFTLSSKTNCSKDTELEFETTASEPSGRLLSLEQLPNNSKANTNRVFTFIVKIKCRKRRGSEFENLALVTISNFEALSGIIR